MSIQQPARGLGTGRGDRRVTLRREIEQLEAEADSCRDRLALLRAKLYRWGLASNARLRALERDLDRAQQRVREARLREGP
jgi:predicted  nucleic acid-binding Zn-ribbon protein